MKPTPSPHRIASLAGLLLLALGTTTVQAAIPAGERTALLDLYTSTNGASWTNHTGWNGAAGTECTWYGVTCNAGGTTVTAINLATNNLTGMLPSDLNTLTNLVAFYAYQNQLTGSLPALAGLTNLAHFDVHSDSSFHQRLTGSIPAFTGLTNLVHFDVHWNQLTGSIPVLTDLTNLVYFNVFWNQLAGSIPALTGLTTLQTFNSSVNSLTGSIPALTELTHLAYFDVDSDRLTGSIPALAGLTNLTYFDVDSNNLTGSIPTLSRAYDLHKSKVSK